MPDATPRSEPQIETVKTKPKEEAPAEEPEKCMLQIQKEEAKCDASGCSWFKWDVQCGWEHTDGDWGIGGNKAGVTTPRDSLCTRGLITRILRVDDVAFLVYYTCDGKEQAMSVQFDQESYTIILRDTENS
jgi:hypothetical protein